MRISMKLFMTRGISSLRSFVCTFILTMLFPALAWALPAPMQPPRMVNDFADMLSLTERDALEKQVRKFERESSTQIYIVTVNSLEGMAALPFATALANSWGVGQANIDNGVLLLIKPKTNDSSGQVAIALGTGVEKFMTSAEAQGIIQNSLISLFKKNLFAEGIQQAAYTIELVLINKFNAPVQPSGASVSSSSLPTVAPAPVSSDKGAAELAAKPMTDAGVSQASQIATTATPVATATTAAAAATATTGQAPEPASGQAAEKDSLSFTVWVILGIFAVVVILNVVARIKQDTDYNYVPSNSAVTANRSGYDSGGSSGSNGMELLGTLLVANAVFGGSKSRETDHCSSSHSRNFGSSFGSSQSSSFGSSSDESDNDSFDGGGGGRFGGGGASDSW